MFDLFSADGFVARRVCGAWSPALVVEHVLGNLVIFLAYLSIPAAMLYFLRRRQDVPFRGVLGLFVAFIVCCGLTHLLDALMFYYPAYRLLGVGLVVTAVVSAGTVVAIWWHMPAILSMPSHQQLQEEIDRRQRSEDLHTSMFCESPVGMMVSQDDGRIIKINPAACDMLGYTEVELVALGWRALTPEEDQPAEDRFLEAWAKKQCPPAVYRKRYRHKSGRMIHIDLYLKRLTDAQSLCIVVDRTAEVDQARELNLRATMIDQVFAGIMRWDADDRIVTWNAAAEQMYGYTAAEAIGRRAVDLLRTEHVTPAPAGRDWDHWSGDLIQQAKDGRRLVTEARWAVFNGTDVIACCRDVTENRRLAAELQTYNDALESRVAERTEELNRANTRLRQASQQKDQFLAMLGHELRNPLSPILTSLAVIRMSSDRRQRSDALDMVDRQARNMTRIVDELLDVSRINSGKIDLRLQVDDLVTIVTRAAQASRSMIDHKFHNLTLALPAGPVWADVDATRIEQVVQNLLTNSAKYTPEGGRITLAMDVHPDRAVIRVRDTGVGIRADMLAAVFELFVQTDRSIERSAGGLGLGLTIVKKLVEMHGGTVVATSPGPNEGSEFVVTLPISTKPRLAPKAEAADDHVAPRKILVVDDNVDAADGLSMLLRLEGHTVQTAYDGEAAIAKAPGAEVVLLDIGLPKVNGYMVARALRREKRLKDIVLVALTGYGQAEDKEAAAEAGFDQHFTKPMDPALLRTFLKRLR